MQTLHTEIEAIRNQIYRLQKERSRMKIPAIAPVNDSPEAISDAYRTQARETAGISAEIKGIDDAIAALQKQLNQKQQQLQQQKADGRNPILQELESSQAQAKLHAQRINELAAELAEEVKALKAIADEISPSYWQVYLKPFITGFHSISVPFVRSDGQVWTIVNRRV
jgi:chromosome segregation ATPase